MDRNITIGNYEIAKEQEKGRNIFRVSMSRTNKSPERTIVVHHSFTEYSEREASIRYAKLLKHAINVLYMNSI